MNLTPFALRPEDESLAPYLPALVARAIGADKVEVKGASLRILNPMRDDKNFGSFVFDLEKRVGQDFAVGVAPNGAVPDAAFQANSCTELLAKLANTPPAEVYAQARRMLEGKTTTADGLFAPVTEAELAPVSTARDKRKAEVAQALPANLRETLPAFLASRGFDPSTTSVFEWCDAAGVLRFLTLRADFVDPVTLAPAKIVRPVVATTGADGPELAMRHYPHPRPLLLAKELSSLIQAGEPLTVVLVEGETSAYAAWHMAVEGGAHDIAATTWCGGSKALNLTDYSLLAAPNVRVVVWPDADAPGLVAAQALTQKLVADGVDASRVSVVRPDASWPEGYDLADGCPPGWTPADVVSAIRQHAGSGLGTEQPDVDMSVLWPLRSAAPDVLDTNFFPPALHAGYLQAGAEATTGSADVLSLTLIAITGALAADAFDLEITPTFKTGTVVQALAVGDPSVGKTPAALPALRLLETLERELEEAAAMLADSEDASDETPIGPIAMPDTLRAWIWAVVENMPEGPLSESPPMFAPPPSRRAQAADDEDMPLGDVLVVGDTTAEALADIALRQERGVFLNVDEGSGFFEAVHERYASAKLLVGLLNSGYSLSSHRVSRKGAGSRPQRIDRLAISYLVLVQPEVVISAIAQQPESGLLQRPLFVFPEARLQSLDDPGAGSAKTLDAALSHLLIALRILRDMAPDPVRAQLRSAPDKTQIPLRFYARDDTVRTPLRFTDEASSRWRAWGIQRQNVMVNTLGAVDSAFSKTKDHCARLAAIRRIFRWIAEGTDEVSLAASVPGTVELEDVEAAITFVETYTEPHAARVRQDAAAPTQERAATSLARFIARTRCPLFSKTAVRRHARETGLRTRTDVEAAVEELTDCGWVDSVAGDTVFVSQAALHEIDKLYRNEGDA